MGTCWYCYWGWPKPVADIFNKALAALGSDYWLHAGPGHIVWSDENFDSAQWCLDHFKEYRGDMPNDAAAIVRRSLEELAALDSAVRDVEPEEYGDADDPENYPPPAGVVMVRHDF